MCTLAIISYTLELARRTALYVTLPSPYPVDLTTATMQAAETQIAAYVANLTRGNFTQTSEGIAKVWRLLQRI